MNQILSTNMPNNNGKKSGQNGPKNIKSIVIFFVAVLIIFAVVLIGMGAYTLFKKGETTTKTAEKPVITLENKTDTTVLLKVMHNTGTISKVYYNWNDDDETTINGNDGKYVEQEIEIPSGNNTLYIRVVDGNGQEATYEKQYELESNINFEVSGNKITITYDGDTTISYMTYRWDDEDEETIQINDKTINQEIDALKGLHTLTVIVVDENNKTDKKVQKINGVSKPTLTIDSNEDNTRFVIHVTDEEELSKIEIVLNDEQEKKYVINLANYHLKEFDYALPIELQDGENIIEVTVYNASDVTTVQKGRLVK